MLECSSVESPRIFLAVLYDRVVNWHRPRTTVAIEGADGRRMPMPSRAQRLAPMTTPRLTPWVSAAIAVVVLGGLTAGAVAASNAWGRPTLASQPGPPPSIQDHPDPERAAGMYFYTIATFINHEVLSRSGVAYSPDRLITERWVELDAEGYANRFLAVTRTLDGAVWQEQIFASKRLTLNHHDRPGDGATCGESDAYAVRGSTLPLMTAANLEGIGFAPATEIPVEVAEHISGIDGSVRVMMRNGRPGASEVSERVSFLAWHQESGQSLGQWNYGIVDGERVLIDSNAISLVQPVDVVSLVGTQLVSCADLPSSPDAGSTGAQGDLPTPSPRAVPPVATGVPR